VRVEAARDPPEPDEPIIKPWLDDPFPSLSAIASGDGGTTTTKRFSRTTENPGSAEVRHEGPPALAFAPPPADDVGFSGVRGAPRTPEKPTIDFHRPIWHLPTMEIAASSF